MNLARRPEARRLSPDAVDRLTMPNEWTVTDPDAGQRLDRFLAAPDRLGSRSRAAAALDRGQVWLNDREQHGAGGATRLAAGDRVALWQDRPGSARRRTRPRRHEGFAVVYQDEALIVVEKQAGLLTVPAPSGERSVLDGLDEEYAARTRRSPLVVHRIDRDTSGLVVFARTGAALGALRRQFVRREPERVYLAIVTGVPAPPRGQWRDHVVWNAVRLELQPAWPGARDVVDATCFYEVKEVLGPGALLEVQLVTGRQNQIRAQAMLHGVPLAGERKYVDPEGPVPIPFERQALHAHRLSFAHPVTGREVSFESPLPADMLELAAHLRRAAPPPARRRVDRS